MVLNGIKNDVMSEINNDEKEKLDNLSDVLNKIISKEFIRSISKIRKIWIYMIISLMIFLMFVWYLIKKTLLLRWHKIPKQFRIINEINHLVLNHLEL